jgi:hypothetical protein
MNSICCFPVEMAAAMEDRALPDPRGSWLPSAIAV